MSVKKYQPSNGTEGDAFISSWCTNCNKYHDKETDKYCQILGATFCFDVEDDKYPVEWVIGEHGPCCTAFSCEEGATPRCDRTIDMFEQLEEK
ncbi:MAG: hypothetical protein OEX07_03345 [Gammaproteobacteria bacterium]|nr:hypothetical protein [Gammaproteobacteria bacterium]